MKCLPALAFVPEDDVITVFEELVLTLPQEPEVEEVVAYFESNYIRGMQIGGRRRDPRFPIKLWNHFEDAEECAPKTTNCCEGFHNALKSVYMCAHPTMWKFLKGIARDIAVQRLVHQNACSSLPLRKALVKIVADLTCPQYLALICRWPQLVPGSTHAGRDEIPTAGGTPASKDSPRTLGDIA
ncbi:hypothetical protein O3P69_010945 [Scylla paramamosain]|uniref:MULE transposase domain-containing protein n=1 Tax=Scylla paramamosain TaxID=85552 RepID=A0AAW0SCA5_SCYPA